MRWCDELYNSGSGGLLAVATGKVLSRMCELPLLPPPRFPRCLFWWLKSVCVCMYLFRQFISCSYTQRESSYGSLCSVNVPVKRRRQTGGNVLFPVVTLMVVVVWMYFLSLRVLCTCCECLLIDWCADHVTKLMNLMRRGREREKEKVNLLFIVLQGDRYLKTTVNFCQFERCLLARGSFWITSRTDLLSQSQAISPSSTSSSTNLHW